MDEHNMLTLDYWQDTVTYEGHTLPAGSLGCAALNISDENIAGITRLCMSMSVLINMTSTGRIAAEAVKVAGENALTIARLMKDTPPFSLMDTDFYRQWFERLFTEQNRVNAEAYAQAANDTGPNAAFEERFKGGVGMLKVAHTLAQLGLALNSYKREMIAFAENLNNSNIRTADGYAAMFGQQFPAELTLNRQDSAWMALTNVTAQYTSAAIEGRKEPQLVKRVHYVSFVGMFRSDLFEGLCVGHAPKKCGICGRWFLTTDARHTKYCTDKAPGDIKGRTCRQLANLQGREMRELADDHPIKAIYTRRMNTILQNTRRGTLDEATAAVLKKLAKDKMERALGDVAYAKGSYEQEMEQTAILAEAKSQMQ